MWNGCGFRIPLRGPADPQSRVFRHGLIGGNSSPRFKQLLHGLKGYKTFPGKSKNRALYLIFEKKNRGMPPDHGTPRFKYGERKRLDYACVSTILLCLMLFRMSLEALILNTALSEYQRTNQTCWLFRPDTSSMCGL